MAKRLSRVNQFKRRKPTTAEVRAARKLAQTISPKLAELMDAKPVKASDSAFIAQ